VRERGAAKVWILAFVVFAAGGLGALIGIGCLISANACPWREEPKQTSRDGATLFAANCAACHGRNGEGRNGPTLIDGPIASATLEELVNKISRGKPLAGMPRFSRTLEVDQIRAVAEYVTTVRGDPSPSPSPSEPSP